MEIIQTTEAFEALIKNIRASTKSYSEPLAFGICRVDMGQLNLDKTLQATYPIINWNENFSSAAIFIKALQEQGVEIDFTQSEVVCNINSTFLKSCLNAFFAYSNEAYGDSHQNIQVVSTLYNQIASSGSREGEFKVTFIFSDEAPKSVEAAYLKLYALSQSKVAIRGINLDGISEILPNVAWSYGEPIELEYLREFEIELKLANEYPHIDFVDKFPRFLSHIIPADNTSVLDTAKVRLGAQLADGTTVTSGAAYVNYNAGTTGAAMVEGRISTTSIVSAGCEIGGGASILGTLSGVDDKPIVIGENSLLGANSTCGIALGENCVIDGGLAVFSGTKFHLNDAELIEIRKTNPDTIFDNYMKGWELAGLHGLHFRQNSLNGQYVVQKSTRK